MILLVHMAMGAWIASKVSVFYLACLLAFLSHYLLDFIPHIEYEVKKSAARILKISFDFFIGLLIAILFFSPGPAGLAVIFFAMIPDGLTILYFIFPKNRFLNWHSDLHRKKLHILKYKKIPNFWRIATQATVVLILILLR